MQSTQTASLDACKLAVYICLIVVLCFVWTAIPFDNATGKPNKEPREVTFRSLYCMLCLWCELSFFSVRLTVSGVLKASEIAVELFPPLVVVVTSIGVSVTSSCAIHPLSHLCSICSSL